MSEASAAFDRNAAARIVRGNGEPSMARYRPLNAAENGSDPDENLDLSD